MAITISGSGITSSEIADGTITTDDIASGVTGKVLQVVSQPAPSVFSTTNSTVQSTGHSATITPTSSSSKIYVLVSFDGYQSSQGRTYKAYLYRGASIIGGLHLYEDGDSNPKTSSCITVLDTPSTTSPVTYEMKIGTDGVGTSYYNYSNTQGKNTITLMEIGA